MKSITLLSLLAVGTSLAGEPAVYDKNPVMPPMPPAPSLYSWFAGATAGYLFENEEEMYTLHLGMDLSNQLAGWDQALYLEVGSFKLDGCIDAQYPDPQGSAPAANVPLSDFESYFYEYGRACFDLEVIPVTLNYKLEKPITQSLNGYLGIGAGVAFIDAEAKIGNMKDSDDDVVFYGQLFAGVLYNVNPSFELFAGARLIYFDEPSFNLFNTNVDIDDIDDAGYEVHNTDVLLEAGARINF